ncbi:hypothetical protein BE20_18300 [Sorangium cellulosum]|nr:hypothetical protein BE20_18300 [Sorangium cellulosum]
MNFFATAAVLLLAGCGGEDAGGADDAGGGLGEAGGADASASSGGPSAAAGSGGGTTAASASAGGSEPSCTDPVVPEVSSLPPIAEHPDPFTFLDGTRMTTAADWRCRRAELSQLIQHFQYGPYPPSPENVTGTLNGDRLTVKVEHGGKSISFDATVSLPNSSGPFPAFIVLSSLMPGLTASAINDKGIGYITIDPNGIAADAKPPRKGKFYDLYQAVWAAREVFEALGIEDHIGWVADDHSHGVMTTREANAILGFAERFLLGKDVTTEQ